MRKDTTQLDLRTIDDALRQRMRERLEQPAATDAQDDGTWAAPFRAAGGKHAIM